MTDGIFFSLSVKIYNDLLIKIQHTVQKCSLALHNTTAAFCCDAGGDRHLPVSK